MVPTTGGSSLLTRPLLAAFANCKRQSYRQKLIRDDTRELQSALENDLALATRFRSRKRGDVQGDYGDGAGDDMRLQTADILLYCPRRRPRGAVVISGRYRAHAELHKRTQTISTNTRVLFLRTSQTHRTRSSRRGTRSEA